MIKKDLNSSTKKPQGTLGTRHLQVFLMSLSMMIADAINFSLPLAIIPMTDRTSTDFAYFDWTTKETSLILSSFIWGYALFQIPSSYLASKWSAHKLFTLGLFVSSLMNVFLPFASFYGDWMALCAGRVVIGICQSTFSSCTTILLSKWAPTTERSRMSSFVTTGAVLGAILATSISGLIAVSRLGWPGIFYTFGGIGLFLSIIFYFNVWDCPTLHKTISVTEKEFIVDNLQQMKNYCEIDRNNMNIPWKKILTSASVWSIIIVECGSSWGKWTLGTQMPNYMKNILHFNIAKNGLVSTLPYLANYQLSFVFSWASDYATREDLASASVIRKTCNTIGMWGPALALVALCCVGTDDNVWPVALLILAIGLKSGTASGYIVNCIDLTPNYAGNVYSFATCLSSCVSMLAPILCGAVIVDVTNVYQWYTIFYITAAVYFVTNLFYIIFGRGKIRSWNNPENYTEPIKTIYDPSITKDYP